MRSKWVFTLVVAAAAATLASAAFADTIAFFRTPSGNIGCVYASGGGTPTELRCDIRSGLKPKPSRPKGCVDLEWGDSYFLRPTGRTGLTCHGDTAIDPHAHVLRYGTTWKRNGITCVSKTSGLRCRNRSGHGFFMSRAHSFRF